MTTFAYRLKSIVACVLALAAFLPAAEAAAEVYKCAGAGGVPLYTDVPCKDGALVDIRPGSADPAAVARLEQEKERDAALTLAKAQRADRIEVDAGSADRGPGAAGDHGAYTSASGIESGIDIVYVPILAGGRPPFRHDHRHRPLPHPYALHRGGATGIVTPAPPRMPGNRFQQPSPGSQVVTRMWK